MKEMEEAGNERACYSFFAWSKIATFMRIVICNADEKKSCKVIREKYVIIGLDKDFLVTTINTSFCPFYLSLQIYYLCTLGYVQLST